MMANIKLVIFLAVIVCCLAQDDCGDGPESTTTRRPSSRRLRPTTKPTVTGDRRRAAVTEAPVTTDTSEDMDCDPNDDDCGPETTTTRRPSRRRFRQTSSTTTRPRTTARRRSATIADDPVTTDTSEDFDCEPNQDSLDLDLLHAVKAIAVIGNRDLFLSEHDGHQQQHCEEGKKSLKKVEQHAACETGAHKDALKLMVTDVRKMVKDRCESKEWHDKHLKFAKCLYDDVVQENLHQCMDKQYEFFDWSLKNLRDGQIRRNTCCFLPYTRRCVMNATLETCGQETAVFAIKLFYEIYDLMIKDFCVGDYMTTKERCIPRAARAADRISRQANTVRHHGMHQIVYTLVKRAYDTGGLQ